MNTLITYAKENNLAFALSKITNVIGIDKVCGHELNSHQIIYLGKLTEDECSEFDDEFLGYRVDENAVVESAKLIGYTLYVDAITAYSIVRSDDSNERFIPESGIHLILTDFGEVFVLLSDKFSCKQDSNTISDEASNKSVEIFDKLEEAFDVTADVTHEIEATRVSPIFDNGLRTKKEYNLAKCYVLEHSRKTNNKSIQELISEIEDVEVIQEVKDLVFPFDLTTYNRSFPGMLVDVKVYDEVIQFVIVEKE